MYRATTTNPIIILLLLLLLPSLAASQSEADYLLPQEAFRLSAEAEGSNAVRVTWQIAEGYYLYRSKIRLISESDDIALGMAQ